MPSVKTKLLPAKRSAIEVSLKALSSHYHWKTLPEQYCQYRLDGKTANGWIRVKQYTNGTFYVDAESATDLSTLLHAIGMADLVANLPGGSTSTVPSVGSTQAYPYAGSDESGKGDYFGPLVVAAVCLPDEATAHAVKRLGIADSKTLTDSLIAKLLPELVDIIGKQNLYISCLMPESYNQHYVATGSNLNTLMSKTHAYVHGQLLQQATIKPGAIVIDNFGGEKKIRLYVEPLGLPVTLATQAESRYVAVAAASCLARHTFVERMRRLSEQWAITLPLGAGANVKATKARFIDQHGADKLPEVAKMHFKV
jgi:ribonuclease HIII